MYSLIIRLLVITAFLEIGLSVTDFTDCKSRACASKLDTAKATVLKINWKPISMFPEEARKFR